MFEEEEEVGGDSSLGSSNSRSRGQTFRKKVPKTSLLHHLLEEEQEDQQTFGSPAFYANDTDRGGGDSGGSTWLRVGSEWAIAGVNSNGTGDTVYGCSSFFAQVSGVQDWIAELVPGVRFLS